MDESLDDRSAQSTAPTANAQSKDNDGSQKISGEKLGDFYKELAREFPIVSIEDPFDQVGGSTGLALPPSLGRVVVLNLERG